MSVIEEPEPLAPDNISIALEVHNGMTKTVYKIKQNGLLKFRNKSHDKTLTIMSANEPLPFLVPGQSGPQSGFVVAENSNLTVQIAPSYGVGDWFAYTAQIEGSTAEDPIVIVDH
jgi:hypothetical protein